MRYGFPVAETIVSAAASCRVPVPVVAVLVAGPVVRLVGEVARGVLVENAEPAMPGAVSGKPARLGTGGAAATAEVGSGLATFLPKLESLLFLVTV